ncbi:hypothetical protein FRB96_003973 [Tulasnella sp. 330]|nr:hypothetical protein FRB96_003973 [Tulasnella sp. 330]KAG8875339.1 hypothetical protein FRB97_005203 [Tulasnella sp. 331]KAG8880289.1 hypothetical protein FRB98_005202 [Tulasnella sp. 332]
MPSLARLFVAIITATSTVVVATAPAQWPLTGAVGPTTSTAAKRAVICNVLDYGGSIGSADIGPAILSAYTNCVQKASTATLYVPPGSYDMQTWVTLDDGNNWAFQMDGVITRTSTTGGHMIIVENANNFEMFSSTSAGAIQGAGYQCRNAGPRLLRIVTSTNWSVHDLIFVDSPEFHVIVQAGTNGELYNLAIRGTNLGGSDGIDISGANHWVHDIEVTNRDECVTVKSPASNFLIERLWCNQSGGSAIGSLSDGTAVENIIYRNVYTNGGNQMMMIKSNLGSGYVQNVLFQNFIGRGSAYGLDVDSYWSSQTPGTGAGVQLTNITFQNWDAEIVSDTRAPVQVICSDGAPCQKMTMTNVNMYVQSGTGVVKCRSAYGTGVACLKASGTTSYAAVTSTITLPAGYTNPPTLAGDLASGFATNSPIPIPTIPSTYYPGLAQISPLAKNIATTGAATTTAATTTKTTTTTTSTSTGTGTVPEYGQCGGCKSYRF